VCNRVWIYTATTDPRRVFILVEKEQHKGNNSTSFKRPASACESLPLPRHSCSTLLSDMVDLRQSHEVAV
jgi:hypothetical protein